MVRALISGANRGIGFALAQAFRERDVFVFAGARNPERCRELQRFKKEHAATSQILPLDVTDPRSIQECLRIVSDAGGRLDLLVNNAAIFLEDSDASLGDLDVSLFDKTFAVNVTGVARLTQAFLPMLLESSTPSIVNISSGAGSIGDRPGHRYYCYGASKAALNHFTVGLANELRPKGVTAVAISPGWVRTDMGGDDAELSAEESAAAIADTILKLKPVDSGQFLDRFGRKGQYEW